MLPIPCFSKLREKTDDSFSTSAAGGATVCRPERLFYLITESGDTPVSLAEQVAVVPFVNLSETPPQAGDRAASIAVAILRAEGGAGRVELYLPEDQNPLMYESQARQAEAMDMADRDGGADLIVTGTVEEWRYKAGFDSEPAVGVTLIVRRSGSNAIVWSGTAARTGWGGRESLGTVGREVLQDLIDAMPLVRGED